MLQKINFILIILLIFSSGLMAYSGPFYVATNGDNAANGSFAAPFRTIQHAADVMSTNVTVASCYIFPGIYSEQVEIYSNKNAGYMVFTALSNNNIPILTGSLSSNHGFYITNTSSIIIRELIITKYSNGIILTGIATNNYIIKNVIYSNRGYGIRFNSEEVDNNYILTNNIWGTNQNYGIYINDGDNNIIKSNQIHNNETYGIYLYAYTKNNYIVKNVIYSNKSNGIYSFNADNNYILTNNIFNNQNYGIHFSSGDKNIAKFNKIYNNLRGICLSGIAISNYIVKNTIYSNDDYGIINVSGSANKNFILTNNIWGGNQNYGIWFLQGDKNIIRLNQIHNHQSDGIFFTTGADYNYIINNAIYSNERYGVCFENNADNNYILSNCIWGDDQNEGIHIWQANNNKIYRNLIHNNQDYGIRITGNATNTKIINNTIFGSIAEDGVSWENISCGTMYNNIILSNGNGAGDYGIENAGTGVVYVSHNCVYGNWDGAMTNSGTGQIIWGAGNTTGEPLIDTTGSFAITSADSPCVDRGIVIFGVSDMYKGSGPDIGWKESSYGTVTLVVCPDKSPGEYIGDLDIRFTVYKDSTKQEIDTTALITVTVFQNDTAYQSHAVISSLDITLLKGAGYKIEYYAVDNAENKSETKEAEYIVLKKSLKDIAVYPTIIDLNKTDEITIVYNGQKSNVDIVICTLRGDIVKKIQGVDFSSGCYNYNTRNLEFLSAGTYLLRIEDKKFVFLLIK